MTDGTETEILCVRCGKNWVPMESTGVVCGACLKKAAPTDSIMIQTLQVQQKAFMDAVDELIAIYRDFDHTRRPELKARMKSFYERMQELGSRIGISRNSLDHLWKG